VYDSCVGTDKLKRHRREISFGDRSEDRESGEGGAERISPRCYTQAETLTYTGSVDWEVIFRRAGIAEEYRQSWRRLVSPGGKTADIPDAHYRWIRRACRADPWRSKILSAIREERKIDPLFGYPHPEWRNRDELHRAKYHNGSNPVAQGSVSTLCKGVSVSATLYWKQGDRPGPLTRRRTTRTVQRFIVGCDGFRTNFRGAQLEEYRKSFQASLARLVTGRWIPEPEPTVNP